MCDWKFDFTGTGDIETSLAFVFERYSTEGGKSIEGVGYEFVEYRDVVSMVVFERVPMKRDRFKEVPYNMDAHNTAFWANEWMQNAGYTDGWRIHQIDMDGAILAITPQRSV